MCIYVIRYMNMTHTYTFQLPQSFKSNGPAVQKLFKFEFYLLAIYLVTLFCNGSIYLNIDAHA